MGDNYKYRFVEVNFLDGTGEKTLTSFGADGWRVRETRPHPHQQNAVVALLERVDPRREDDADPRREDDADLEAARERLHQGIIRLFKETGGHGPRWAELQRVLAEFAPPKATPSSET